MRFIIILTAIALVLFWILPFGWAVAGAVIAALILAAKLRDAAHHGRLVIAARKKDDNADAAVQDMYRRDALFYAMWIGLTVSGGGHGSDSYVHGQHGGDFSGGDHGGGSGDSGGGDGGGM